MPSVVECQKHAQWTGFTSNQGSPAEKVQQCPWTLINCVFCQLVGQGKVPGKLLLITLVTYECPKIKITTLCESYKIILHSLHNTEFGRTILLQTIYCLSLKSLPSILKGLMDICRALSFPLGQHCPIGKPRGPDELLQYQVSRFNFSVTLPFCLSKSKLKFHATSLSSVPCQNVIEPHGRGSVLFAAVSQVFTTVPDTIESFNKQLLPKQVKIKN